jgi:hypothetical protein
LFGGELEAVVMRENITGGVPGGMATSMAVQSNVPIIVRRCVEEVERRGLDIIGKSTEVFTVVTGNQLQYSIYSLYFPCPDHHIVRSCVSSTWPVATATPLALAVCRSSRVFH